MFSPETQAQIADISKWMDATMVQLGTEHGHAKSAVRHFAALVRLEGGDMSRVEEIIAEHVAAMWRATGCEQVASAGMTPLFAEDEVPGVTRAVREFARSAP